jgi:hypothetical protein
MALSYAKFSIAEYYAFYDIKPAYAFLGIKGQYPTNARGRLSTRFPKGDPMKPDRGTGPITRLPPAPALK